MSDAADVLSLPITGQPAGAYDLIVVGGGPSGIPAALAAARAGLKVLLVEAQAQLGGVGVSAGVSHLLGGRWLDNRGWCVAGIFREIVEDLVARGGATHPASFTVDPNRYSEHGWFKGHNSLTVGVPFDPFAMACLLDRKMLDAGVDVLFQTGLVQTVVRDQRIGQVVLFNKSGLSRAACKAVVDASGDGDVAARSGCEFVKGREGDGLMTPVSLIFHVDQVDVDVVSQYIHASDDNRMRRIISDLRQRGEWNLPFDIFISVALSEPGVFMINTSRLTEVDGTDAASLSRGLMRGRAEVGQLLDLMRRHVPGFSRCRLRFVAPTLGVRETRRIVGDFVLSVEDLTQRREFEDVIGLSSYGWDLPDPKRPSHQPMESRGLPREYTPIPYRVLVPRPVENLIVVGRCISVERDVLGPLRVQGPCYAMGQAAGQAAAQVVRKGVAFKDVDVAQLRSELRAAGAIVDYVVPAEAPRA